MTTTKKRTSPTTCQFYILISLYFLLIVALAINCNWGATILTIIVPFTAYQIIQYPHSIGIRLCLGMIVLAGILIQIFQELNIYAATTLNRSMSQIMHAIPLTHSTIALCKLCPFQSSTHKKKKLKCGCSSFVEIVAGVLSCMGNLGAFGSASFGTEMQSQSPVAKFLSSNLAGRIYTVMGSVGNYKELHALGRLIYNIRSKMCWYFNSENEN